VAVAAPAMRPPDPLGPLGSVPPPDPPDLLRCP
jgi:hypothetical protein